VHLGLLALEIKNGVHNVFQHPGPQGPLLWSHAQQEYRQCEDFASLKNSAAHSLTCATEPGLDARSCLYVVCMESITRNSGAISLTPRLCFEVSFGEKIQVGRVYAQLSRGLLSVPGLLRRTRKAPFFLAQVWMRPEASGSTCLFRGARQGAQGFPAQFRRLSSCRTRGCRSVPSENYGVHFRKKIYREEKSVSLAAKQPFPEPVFLPPESSISRNPGTYPAISGRIPAFLTAKNSFYFRCFKSHNGSQQTETSCKFQVASNNKTITAKNIQSMVQNNPLFLQYAVAPAVRFVET